MPPPAIDPASAQIGGHTRVRRTEGLLRSVIGAVVQGTRRRENRFPEVRPWFSRAGPREVVQSSKGLQADNTRAYRSAHKAFYETFGARPGDCPMS